MYRQAMRFCTIFLFLAIGWTAIEADEESPSIIVVGAGASGIAAVTKLLENGFQEVVVLEAENRIGGRIHTVEFANRLVDLGAQWVHGQEGNVAYEMAAPLGLVDSSQPDFPFCDVYDSAGNLVNTSITEGLETLFRDIHDKLSDVTNGSYASIGEFLEIEFKRYFDEHPEVSENLQRGFMLLFNLMQSSSDASDSWADVAISDYIEFKDTKGNILTNWKERGYSTILDILMKKLPDPLKELPVMSHTVLNAEVTKVDYTGEKVKVQTADGEEYLADHVIMTPSLGVLKADHQTLFEPPLSELKVTQIEGLEFGSVCKTFLSFDDPWWEANSSFGFLWSDNDRMELENDPERKWLLSVIAYSTVVHKPNLLAGWYSGKNARLMENVPDDQVLNQTMSMLNQFLSKYYNITNSVSLIRSKWYTNKHFRGTYSFRSIKTDRMGASAEELSQPIMKSGKPVILFAGEATNKDHFSTVHGAIETGWREANRLIDLYSSKTGES